MDFAAILINLVPIIAVFAVFYFLLILPEKKRKKQYEAMIEGISLNDEILTRGGLVGKIVGLDGDYMTLQTGPDNVKIKMVKNSIATKIYKDADKKDK